jgi:hypothetical protein
MPRRSWKKPAPRSKLNNLPYAVARDFSRVFGRHERRKAILLLTGGMDNCSRSNADAVTHAIGAGGLTISTIGLGNPRDVVRVSYKLFERRTQKRAASDSLARQALCLKKDM